MMAQKGNVLPRHCGQKSNGPRLRLGVPSKSIPASTWLFRRPALQIFDFYNTLDSESVMAGSDVGFDHFGALEICFVCPLPQNFAAREDSE